MLNYVILFLVAMTLSLVVFLLTQTLSKKMMSDQEHLSIFECGFTTFYQGVMPFSLRFYLVANIFLIFDVELILLFPFLTKTLLSAVWVSMWLFAFIVLILSMGLFHEWNQKMLEWSK